MGFMKTKKKAIIKFLNILNIRKIHWLYENKKKSNYFLNF